MKEPIPWQDGLVATLAALVPIAAAWAIGGAADGAMEWIGLTGLAGATAIALAALLCWREDRRWQTGPGQELGPARARRSWIERVSAGAGLFLLLQLAFSQFNPAFKPAFNEDGQAYLAAVDYLSTLPATTSPGRSAPAILMFVGWGAFCLSLRFWKLDPRAVELLRFLLLLNAVALAVAGIFFHLLGSDQILGAFEPVEGASYFFATFHYKNHWAALALLAVTLSLGFLLGSSRSIAVFGPGLERSGRPFFVIATVVLGLSIALSDSRSGMLLLALVLVVLVVALWQRSRRARWAAFFALPLGMALIATAAWPELSKRWAETEGQVEKAGGSLLEVDRVRLREGPLITTEMALDRPWWGWGYRSYAHVFPLYATPPFYHPRSGELQSVLQYAHNDWLQFWAETGSIGLASLLLWLAAPVFGGLRPRHDRLSSVWTLTGLAFLGLFALWDFPFSNPAIFASASLLLFTLPGRENPARTLAST